MAMTKRVSVTGHYINSRLSVQAWMAFCCGFSAYLDDGSKTEQQGWDGCRGSFLPIFGFFQVLQKVFRALLTVRSES